ncbi:MAG: GAF domain-containing protein [Candidatus Zixiibacteriota bacterium]
MDRIESHHFRDDEPAIFGYDIDQLWPKDASPADIFIGLTRELQRFFAIHKGVLIIHEQAETRFTATATFNQGRTRRNLSLKLPGTSSLFQIVAENGQLYAENFTDLFSGNSFERHLLLEADSQSFMIQPLKYDGNVVGLLGYSSSDPLAFATFEDNLLTTTARQFAERIGKMLVRK